MASLPPFPNQRNVVLLQGTTAADEATTTTRTRTMDIQLTPLDGNKVGDFVGNDIHPKDLPRQYMHLQANYWTGRQHDNIQDAMATALAEGFAVLADPEAMFRTRKSNTTNDAQETSFIPTANWFMNVNTSPDTTTIPYTDWLPRNTHYEFAQYLHRYVFDDDDKTTTTPFDALNGKENYAGVLSIGGARRRASHGADSPNLQFPHQDECKWSVLMAECVAQGAEQDPFEGLHDTVKDVVSHCYNQEFRKSNKTVASNDAKVAITCRQINFWFPHERNNGDKYLVIMTRRVSEALAQAGQGFVTAAQLPRFSQQGGDHFALSTVNRNFQLTDRALRMIADQFPDRVFVINKPVIFVSHWSRIGDGTPLAEPSDAGKAIFHCGATARDGSGHCSTEMRIALFSQTSV